MNKNCPYEPGYKLPDKDDDEVYQRIISYGVSKNVYNQIIRFLDDGIGKLDDITVQAGFFKPLRKLKSSENYEKGKSVNWSQCSTPLDTKLNHDSIHEDERFGVISLQVKKLNELNEEEFLTEELYCKYDPIEGNDAHCLIIGFPNRKEAESHREIEFQELRQRLSIIAKWKELPTKFQY